MVELILDADDSVIERRVVPYPIRHRAEAVDTIGELSIDDAYQDATAVYEHRW